MLAGVPPIGIVIEERARLYKITHNTEQGEFECEQPQQVKEWPHPALRPTFMEPQESMQYSKVIFTDGSKSGDKVGAGAAIYVDQEVIKRCKYKLGSCCTNNQAEQLAILKSLEELSFLPDHKDNGGHVHRQPGYSRFLKEQLHTHANNCRNTEKDTTTNNAKLDDPLWLGKITHRH